ncbi:uncharacterized protein A1O5_10408 [Cladophialophora psammophila CBS 110553]|uniref:Cupin 2 conserved barrel domain-containing protein n=1 Tax=Cladophialophora psammophila CBS 110553 TaxID=1182543 RepID=W9WNL6_9EURO|nr:uncharacterized protein A1O5_10408 [Cladophialophora psammophila CBS 110553]EXJ66256.1 hypothetical protein A1O5_10408 [Cladophialophora psammophila CBS 110553]
MTITRRQTSNITVFKRTAPEAVTYDLSKSDSVTITVPVASTWTSGPHWHETHAEFLQILQGRALVKLGDRSGVYGAGDGVIEVPIYTVHEWRRIAGDDDQGDLMVREWTIPEDGEKEGFFRMLTSFLTEPHPSSLYQAPSMTPKWVRTQIEHWIVVLQLFCIFHSWDNWPVLVGEDSGWVSWAVTHLVLTFSSAIGFVLGLRGTYGAYVSDELMSKATRENGARKAR